MILGFIGTGKISSSIIFGIFKSKLKIKRIYISSRNRNIAKKLSKSYGKVKILNNNQEIIDKLTYPKHPKKRIVSQNTILFLLFKISNFINNNPKV